jgi:hypothetical protein
MAVPYVEEYNQWMFAACVKHYVANNQEKDEGNC